MKVYKVSAKHCWGPWKDFRFIYAGSKKQAILSALEEIDIPEAQNEKILITVSQEGTINDLTKRKH